MTERLYTDQEVADMLGKTKRTVQTNCRTGKRAHTRIGRSYYFTETQSQALIDGGRRVPLTAPERRACNKKVRALLSGL